MTFQKSFLKSAISNDTKKPNTPQIIIKNPLKKDIYVNAINLVSDIYFSLKGRCEIKINSNTEFSPKDNAFQLRKELLIPLENQILEQGKSIEIFVWNPIDTDLVTLSAQIIISENKGNLTLSGQAIDDNTMLKGISGGAGDEADTHDIFPYRQYEDCIEEFLINTKGRGNLLLTIAVSDVGSPTIISNGGFSSGAIADNDLTSKSTIRVSGKGVTLTYEVIADFGTLDIRTMRAKISAENITSSSTNWKPNSFSLSHLFHTSEDGINYALAEDNTNMRYAKLIITVVIADSQRDPAQFDLNLYELYDNKTVGGTASLSFLLKGVNEQWFTILDSDELGAVTYGQAKVIKYDIAGIPPTQSRFKARLEVVGSLKTGVSIDMVD
jgi:hypothetical protein